MGVANVAGIGERTEGYDATGREDLVHEAGTSHAGLNLL